MAWTDRIDQLLYEGESEQQRVTVGQATIVVTSHRVLAFTPDGDQQYWSVDRPNVDTVTVESTGSIRYLLWTVGLACLAIAGAITALVFSFTSLVSTPDLDSESAADGSGAGATDIATESIATIESMLAIIDVAVVVTSALAIGLAAACFVLYVRSRSRQLVLSVLGGDDLAIPVGSETVGTTPMELQNAIRPGPILETDTALEDLRDDVATEPADADATASRPFSEMATGKTTVKETTAASESESSRSQRDRWHDETRDEPDGWADDPDQAKGSDLESSPPGAVDRSLAREQAEPFDREPFDPDRPESNGGGVDLETADEFDPGSSAATADHHGSPNTLEDDDDDTALERTETGAFEFDTPWSESTGETNEAPENTADRSDETLE
ncbi:hypothetical protein D8Y22_22140 [Salinadaptatus halalkaliphilus]|uniref:Uncharacterized protein n=1 Tax=Salinadaptatus halalkaliphilus TaxID=2419781 RepID=A0A4S3TFU0_9EURY|nr:hypothetical protein [Salinadaptatus halalkaliphilus]THE62769.1 hypothetical protein D8Y22_22140 [Salinadaptatus halalkaliphilus]